MIVLNILLTVEMLTDFLSRYVIMCLLIGTSYNNAFFSNCMEN